MGSLGAASGSARCTAASHARIDRISTGFASPSGFRSARRKAWGLPHDADVGHRAHRRGRAVRAAPPARADREAPWLQCLGEAANGRAAIAAIDELQPDLVFLDVQLPGAPGSTCSRVYGTRRP